MADDGEDASDLLAGHVARRLAEHAPARLTDGRRSAVLALLYGRGGQPHLILTRRTDTVAHHQGQVCLPGGRFDEDDGRLLETALRETREELGIATDGITILGRLDDVHTMGSGFVISPFVGYVQVLPPPVPNPHEIARVLEVPIDDLIAADDRLPSDLTVGTLRYPLLGEDVWGATARILRALCLHLRGAGRVVAGSAAGDAERGAAG